MLLPLQHNTQDTLQTDVLVIGAGAAGIRAALSAAQAGASVLLAAQNPPAIGGSTFSTRGMGWGIQALMGNERTSPNLESFYDDILRVGLGCCVPDLVRVLVEESGPRLEDLLTFGLELRRGPSQSYLRVPGCFSQEPRAYLANDRSNIRTTFKKMLRRSRARFIQATVLGLLKGEEACWGCWAIDPAGKIICIRAKSTVLASGGGAGFYQTHLAPGSQTGSSYALARLAGAQLHNLEFVQFLLMIKENQKLIFLPLARLCERHSLTDSQGRDLMTFLPEDCSLNDVIDQRKSHGPFSSRDESVFMDLAIAQKQKENEWFFWQPNAVSPPGRVLHSAQAFNGGLTINAKAESTLPGLFAAGEAAAGPHGADRIGGCMLAATQVFGHHAGVTAAEWAAKIHNLPRTPMPPDFKMAGRSRPEDPPVEIKALLKTARQIFSREVTVLREAKGLKICLEFLTACLKAIETSPLDPLTKIKLHHPLLAMESITQAALDRNHSLGPHYRTDDRVRNPD